MYYPQNVLRKPIILLKRECVSAGSGIYRIEKSFSNPELNAFSDYYTLPHVNVLKIMYVNNFIIQTVFVRFDFPKVENTIYCRDI